MQASLASSSAPWRLVYFHHSPYSSGSLHGTATGQGWYMQWPFKEWGATAVLTGHDHIYERMLRGGLTYLVVGIGGDGIDPFSSVLDPYSQVRYNATYGALRIGASETNIIFRCINRTNALIDTLTFEALPATLGVINALPFQLRLNGSPGQNYVTEASADLNAWLPISTNAPGPSRSVVVTDHQSPAHSSRFYRARIGH